MSIAHSDYRTSSKFEHLSRPSMCSTASTAADMRYPPKHLRPEASMCDAGVGT